MKAKSQNWMQQQFNQLQKRLERAIEGGNFASFAQSKQLQLLRRLQNYANQLKYAVKPALATVLLAFGLGQNVQAQIVFTDLTNTNSNPLDSTSFMLIRYDFADLDTDGDMDLLLCESYSELRYYKNIGSATSANLEEQMGVNNPFDTINIGYFPSPAFADIDNDGDKDLFLGGINGTIRYFQNTGTANAPIFAQQFAAANPLDTVDVGNYSSPVFVDIDNDADFDLFVGEKYGHVKYYQNTGTASSPLFIQQIGANNPFDTVDVGFSATPNFVDLDKDGDMDAFIGEVDPRVGVNYFVNTGTATAAQFASQTTIGTPFDTLNVGSNISFDFVDLDGDHDMDAFLTWGDALAVYIMHYFRNDSPTGVYKLPSVAPSTLVVYPNPNSGVLFFEKPISGLATVYNSLGQSVQATVLNNQTQLNTEKLSVGTYFLCILGKDGQIYNTRFEMKD